MDEAETRAELIDPALKTAGWGIIEHSGIGREVITPGRLIDNGKRANPEYADYVLVYRGEKLAFIEAKKRDLLDTEGLGQAKKYAEKLQTRFAYSTNGDRIYQKPLEPESSPHPSPSNSIFSRSQHPRQPSL
jgi:type I restriction enzyme, R subunit